MTKGNRQIYLLDSCVWIEGFNPPPDPESRSSCHEVVDAVINRRISVLLPTLVLLECQKTTQKVVSLLNARKTTIQPIDFNVGLAVDVADFMEIHGFKKNDRMDCCHALVAGRTGAVLVTDDAKIVAKLSSLDDARIPKIVSSVELVASFPKAPPQLIPYP
ncbi:type II toxin-antitoxin system VapC family toxin [bacterium]|nr:MAG: type II toxin-antitoxin system VapC family toxin [bacterium]